MALAAVTDGADQILAARRAGGRYRRRWRLPRRERREPGRQEHALEHRHGDLLRLIGPLHRRQGAQKRDERLEILRPHPVEYRVRVHRDQAFAVRPATQTDRGDELLVGPAADAGLAVGRDVGRVHRPERAVVFPPARIDGLLRDGVATAAPGRAEDVLAPRDLGGGGRLRGRNLGEQSRAQYHKSEDQTPGLACQGNVYWRTKVKSVSS